MNTYTNSTDNSYSSEWINGNNTYVKAPDTQAIFLK